MKKKLVRIGWVPMSKRKNFFISFLGDTKGIVIASLAKYDANDGRFKIVPIFAEVE